MITVAVFNNQINSDQFKKILGYIKSGIEGGATLETGGEQIGSKGYYIQPTVFSNVKVSLTHTLMTDQALRNYVCKTKLDCIAFGIRMTCR